MKKTLLEDSSNMLDAIRRVQSSFISERDCNKIYCELLTILLEQTNSKIGFLTEIHLNNEKLDYKILAASPELTNISHLNHLFTTVINMGRFTIVSGEAFLPEGNNELIALNQVGSMLLTPIYLKGRIVAIAGIANDQIDKIDQINRIDYQEKQLDSLKLFFNTCAELIPAIRKEEERRESENELQRNYQNQRVINSLLSLSLEDLPLEKLLEKALNLCLSIPWLLPNPRGCIFLSDHEDGKLVMKARKGILGTLNNACREVRFGQCFCGIAALKQQIQFSSGVNGSHMVGREEGEPHGHYCVPITLEGRTLGVLNVYLKVGHSRSISEENFLSAVANTLAIVIQRRKAEQALREREASLAYAQSIAGMGNFDLNILTGGVRWSDEVYRIFGLKPGNEQLNNKTFVKHVHPEDVAFIREVMKKALYDHEEYKVTFRIIRPDGTLRYVKEQAEVTFDDSGKPVRMVGTVHDITEQILVNEKIKKSLDNLHSAFKGSIKAMASTVEMKDPYTAGHQRRVAELAVAIASRMNLDKKRIEGIQMAGLIHDFGKISVPAEILSKPGRITEIEFGLIKHHSQVAYDVLKTVDFPWPIADIVLQHHERIDGSGYPNGLNGQEIMLEARIISVADVVEAIASHRPYRASLGVKTALDEIRKNRGRLYDADVVDACLKIFTDKNFNLDLIS